MVPCRSQPGQPTLFSSVLTKSLASSDTSFHALRLKLGCSLRMPFQMTAARICGELLTLSHSV